MDNKKIALCISGKSRSSMFCFPYIYDAFINNNYNVDVFIHTWDECRVIDLYNPKKLEIENEQEVLNSIIPQLNLENIKIEGNIGNNILMYYSIKKCFNLIDDTYDIVIRSRFDLLLQPKFDIIPIITDLNLKKYDIYIPNESFNMGGYNDQVAIGTYNSMKSYSDTILNLNEFANKLRRWHPETFLKKQLDDNNIKVNQTDLDYRLVRNVSATTHWPENPYKFLNL
jgi:hypothetical protein